MVDRNNVDIYQAQAAVPVFFEGNSSKDQINPLRLYFKFPVFWLDEMGERFDDDKLVAHIAVANQEETTIVLFTFERDFGSGGERGGALQMFCIKNDDHYQYRTPGGKTDFTLDEFERWEGVDIIYAAKSFIDNGDLSRFILSTSKVEQLLVTSQRKPQK